MTIYVDKLFSWESNDWRKGLWSHLWSDTSDEELKVFALSIGCLDSWFQTNNPRFHHYDLRPSMRQKAIHHGAVQIELRQYIKDNMNRKSQYDNSRRD